MIRICIVDDHAIVRAGIRQLLSEVADVSVVGEAGSGAEALQLARAEGPDLVLLDMSMPGRSGIDLIKDLRRDCPACRLLVLSMHQEEQYAVRAIRAGAHGYLTKTSVPAELMNAVRRVAAGRLYVTPETAEQLALSVGQPRPDEAPHLRLSDREHQVFVLLARGLTVTQIAEQLCLSSKTISTHKARVLQKLGLGNLAELVRYAVRQGLVDAPVA